MIDLIGLIGKTAVHPRAGEGVVVGWREVPVMRDGAMILETRVIVLYPAEGKKDLARVPCLWPFLECGFR